MLQRREERRAMGEKRLRQIQLKTRSMRLKRFCSTVGTRLVKEKSLSNTVQKASLFRWFLSNIFISYVFFVMEKLMLLDPYSSGRIPRNHGQVLTYFIATLVGGVTFKA